MFVEKVEFPIFRPLRSLFKKAIASIEITA